MSARPPLRRYVVSEYTDGARLVSAAEYLRLSGLQQIDVHSPYPLPGTERALGLGRPRIPLLVLLGALVGAVAGYLMIVWMNAIDWPIDVGNRPPHSPPANIPITFELGVLFGSGFAFFGLFVLIGLPRLYHPLFQIRIFARAAVGGFLLSVRLDPGDDLEQVVNAVRSTHPLDVQTTEEVMR